MRNHSELRTTYRNLLESAAKLSETARGPRETRRMCSRAAGRVLDSGRRRERDGLRRCRERGLASAPPGS
eukprot:2732465-Alexandrium_andersonii.AAC.1